MATRAQILPRHRRKNLVVLVYAPNPCYMQVKTLEEVEGIDSLAVSCQTGMWRYREGQNRAIGESNGGLGSGVIGVYDKTNVKHLNAMIYRAEDNAYSKSRHGSDD